jgi:hypothetical protein
MRLNKFLKIFLCVGFIKFGFIACKKIVEPIQQATFVYVNKLSNPVVFKLTDTNRNISWEAKMASGDSLLFKVQGSPGALPFSENEIEKRTGDLITINFGNGKCTKYSKDISSGTFGGTGVFKLNNYQNFSQEIVNSKKYTLRYYISDVDLKIAQNCN